MHEDGVGSLVQNGAIPLLAFPQRFLSLPAGVLRFGKPSLSLDLSQNIGCSDGQMVKEVAVLDEIVARTALHHGHRQPFVAMPGHHDERRHGRQCGKQLDAGHVRQ